MERRLQGQGMTRPPRPIADHGAIGDLGTMALVALDGSVDYLCWPKFDSPSVFAALLDPERGGQFRLAPEMVEPRVLQRYRPDTNVLTTTWLSEQGAVELTDFMPLRDPKQGPRLVRRCSVQRGRVELRLECRPCFDYGRQPARVERDGDDLVLRGAAGEALRLSSSVELTMTDGAAVARIVMVEGQHADFVLSDAAAPRPEGDAAATLELDTVRYWRSWVARSSYSGRWRDALVRSALVLKLMTYEPSGAIVAAPTFGLPEAPGGERNWDYRATWIRDASFSVYALIRLGHREEALAFARFVAARVAECDEGRLQVMYGIDGGPVRDETALEHLSGYGGARPVRIGNGAAGQLQLDIYGALLDSAYLTNKYGAAISRQDWQGLRRVVDYVCEHWQEPDAGIWEVRTEPTENLHSRLMCWVTVDRALRLASKRSLSAPFGRWVDARNAISEDIWSRFYDPKLGRFVAHEGTSDLDGSMLMLPLVRFVGATEPAWLATLDAIDEQLTSDDLVLRYDRKDGLEGIEGSFAACAFWRAECLARAGRLDEARDAFEKLLSYGNHLQLFSEEFGQRADLLGNFPQAFTHLALISAAFFIDRALDSVGPQLWPA
jgi:GH15 family glucan-1,4-alpha-glucosidase